MNIHTHAHVYQFNVTEPNRLPLLMAQIINITRVLPNWNGTMRMFETVRGLLHQSQCTCIYYFYYMFFSWARRIDLLLLLPLTVNYCDSKAHFFRTIAFSNLSTVRRKSGNNWRRVVKWKVIQHLNWENLV